MAEYAENQDDISDGETDDFIEETSKQVQADDAVAVVPQLPASTNPQVDTVLCGEGDLLRDDVSRFPDDGGVALVKRPALKGTEEKVRTTIEPEKPGEKRNPVFWFKHFFDEDMFVEVKAETNMYYAQWKRMQTKLKNGSTCFREFEMSPKRICTGFLLF